MLKHHSHQKGWDFTPSLSHLNHCDLTETRDACPIAPDTLTAQLLKSNQLSWGHRDVRLLGAWPWPGVAPHGAGGPSSPRVTLCFPCPSTASLGRRTTPKHPTTSGAMLCNKAIHFKSAVLRKCSATPPFYKFFRLLNHSCFRRPARPALRHGPPPRGSLRCFCSPQDHQHCPAASAPSEAPSQAG